MVEKGLKVSVIIPTYQGRGHLPALWASLEVQTLKPFEVLVVDSSSPDGTAELARRLGARVLSIPKESFDHGLTRTLAGQAARGEVLVYLTQDVRLAHAEALERLVAALHADQVAVAYGRQIAPKQMGLLSILHREFNYPEQSRFFSYEDRHLFGLRTVFSSHSFAAYWRRALEQIGWFPALPALEDVHAAARLLKAGWRLAYVAEARVFHAHRFSLAEEFRRYLTIGRFYASQSWILYDFGRAEGEGWRYLRFVSTRLLRRAPWLLPAFLLQTGVRFLGYRLGRLLPAPAPKRGHLSWPMSPKGDTRS